MAVTAVKFGFVYFCIGVLLNQTCAERSKRQGWFGQPKPPGKRCLFNPCDSGVQFCSNGAHCSLVESNCMYKCHCLSGFTGQRCESQIEIVEPDEGDIDEDSTTTSTTTTVSTTTRKITTTINIPGAQNAELLLRSIVERTCRHGFVCKHGYCDKTVGLSCTCDRGWFGQLCSIKSTKNEDLHVTKKHPDTDTPSIADKIRQIQNDDSCSPDYVLRPQHIRECVKGVFCIFGSCKTLDDNNGFRCECDAGAVGSLCDKRCCQKCGDHGICRIQNDTEYCSCELGYTGNDCNDKIDQSAQQGSKAGSWYLWLIGVCACIFIILLLMVVILPYLLWYNRNRTIMKAVYSVQPFEDDDDMKWDAFVSYKSDGLDENFVNNKLKPVLEGEFGFTLCLPQRDFNDRKTLEKNILDAVLNSRRIILVLTPRYIHSEFTRYEYHCAHLEILKRKNRIIPIILDDISAVKTSTDPILKKSINHIKCLKWSNDGKIEKENVFWEKIKLSMPKRRTLKNWSKGTRKIKYDNYLNDKQIVLAFSENDKFINVKDCPVKKYSEDVDTSKKHTYENVGFESEKSKNR